jgi:hypothetical protein
MLLKPSRGTCLKLRPLMSKSDRTPDWAEIERGLASRAYFSGFSSCKTKRDSEPNLW